MTTKFNFEGKVALVTGGSRGIGHQIILDLLKFGAKKVINVSRTNGELNSLLSNYSDRLESINCDLSNWEDTKKCLVPIHDIDYLINNAGFGIVEEFGKIEENEFDKIFNLNVKSLINTSQIVSNIWRQQGRSGVIVNMSSQASKRALLNHTVYCASKAAVDAITRNMALELGKFGIRVNSANPTVVMTELAKPVWTGDNATNMMNRLALNRFAEVEDVSHSVLFLLSDSSSMITGSTVPIDGGFWAF